MIAQFISSARNIEEDLPYFNKIIEVIHDNDGMLARNWLGAVQARIDRDNRENDDKEDWEEWYKEIVDSIISAHVVIIETTLYAYMQGFYTAVAIQHKKPTLVLLREYDIKKHPIFGIQSEYITVKIYENLDDLEKIVNAFIKSIRLPAEELNLKMTLDHETSAYIGQLSKDTGHNASEVIKRILIENAKHK
jgi:hypothetical protein